MPDLLFLAALVVGYLVIALLVFAVLTYLDAVKDVPETFAANVATSFVWPLALGTVAALVVVFFGWRVLTLPYQRARSFALALAAKRKEAAHA